MSGVVYCAVFSCNFIKLPLAATHTVTAIQTFVASTTTDSNVPAGIAGRCITLHTF